MSIKFNPQSLIDKKFLGIPYKLGAKTFDQADCIGVAILWLKEQGIDYQYDDKQGPVMAHWWEHKPRRFLDAFLTIGNIVKFSELRKYDCILLLGDEQSSFPSCVGIMIDDRHFLTSLESRGSFIDMMSMYWKSKFWSAVRLHRVSEIMDHAHA